MPIDRPLYDPSLPAETAALDTGKRHFFHVGWIHDGSPFETAAWLTLDESTVLQAALDDISQHISVSEPFVSHTRGFMGDPDLASLVKSLDEIISERLPNGDSGIAGRLADFLAEPTAPPRSLADEIHTLSQKLRAMGCAVVVFSAADLPEQMENRDDAFLDVADRLQDILVERGNEFLGDCFPNAFAVEDNVEEEALQGEESDGSVESHDLESHGRQI